MACKSYSELITLPTFIERLTYLRTDSLIGVSTLGGQRYLGQEFYTSTLWRHIRDQVIVRDNGCDLGLEGYPIHGIIHIHHIIPITREMIVNRDPLVTSLDNLICASDKTHNMIHFGTDIFDPNAWEERKPYDTCPWKQKKG